MQDSRPTSSRTTRDGAPPSTGLSPNLRGRELWRSLEDLAQSEEFQERTAREFQEGAQNLEGDDRRHFMKIMGAGFALAGLGFTGCRRLPETKIAPYAKRPSDRDPGVSVEYASSCEIGGTAYPVLVRSYDGLRGGYGSYVACSLILRCNQSLFFIPQVGDAAIRPALFDAPRKRKDAFLRLDRVERGHVVVAQCEARRLKVVADATGCDALRKHTCATL